MNFTGLNLRSQRLTGIGKNPFHFKALVSLVSLICIFFAFDRVFLINAVFDRKKSSRSDRGKELQCISTGYTTPSIRPLFCNFSQRGRSHLVIQRCKINRNTNREKTQSREWFCMITSLPSGFIFFAWFVAFIWNKQRNIAWNKDYQILGRRGQDQRITRKSQGSQI